MNSTRDKDTRSDDDKDAKPPQSGEAPSIRGGGGADKAERVASATEPEPESGAGAAQAAQAAQAQTMSSVPPKIVPTPISSSPIVISRDSFGPPSSDNAPPSTIIENAMTRGQKPTPLRTVIGIACGVFVVLVGLALLLFR